MECGYVSLPSLFGDFVPTDWLALATVHEALLVHACDVS